MLSIYMLCFTNTHSVNETLYTVKVGFLRHILVIKVFVLDNSTHSYVKLYHSKTLTYNIWVTF